MVAYIIDSGHTKMLQREAERLGKTIHAPDMHNIRLEVSDGIAQRLVVMLFKLLELVEAEPWMPVVAMYLQISLDVVLGRGRRNGFESVIAGQHTNIMSSLAQRLCDGCASEFITADVMRRVKIGKSKDSHGIGNVSPMGRSLKTGRHSPQVWAEFEIPPLNWG